MCYMIRKKPKKVPFAESNGAYLIDYGKPCGLEVAEVDFNEE